MAVSIDPGFGIPAVLTEKLIDYVVGRIQKSRNTKKAWDKVLDEGQLEVPHDEASQKFMLAEIKLYNNNSSITCAAWTKFARKKWWVNQAEGIPDGFLGIFVKLFEDRGTPDLGNLEKRPLQKLKVKVARPCLKLYLGDETEPPISLWEYKAAAQDLKTVSGSWYGFRFALSLPARAVPPRTDVRNRIGVPIPHAVLFALATVLANAQYSQNNYETVCVPFKLVKVERDDGSEADYGYEYVGTLPQQVLDQALIDIQRGGQWCEVYVRPGANFVTNLW